MKTKRLVVSSMLIAIATVLSFLKVFELPFGGTVTAASMMPVVLIAYIYGVKWGVFSAFAFSVIQLISGMGTVSAFFMPGDSQMTLWAAITVCLLDYILAYSVLGFAGAFKNKIKNNYVAIIAGTVLVCVMRFAVHVISGAVFFGSWAEWFFADSTGLSQVEFTKDFCLWVMKTFSGNTLAWFYSVVYNAAYMVPETLITVFAVPAVYKIFVNSKITQ